MCHAERAYVLGMRSATQDLRRPPAVTGCARSVCGSPLRRRGGGALLVARPAPTERRPPEALVLHTRFRTVPAMAMLWRSMGALDARREQRSRRLRRARSQRRSAMRASACVLYGSAAGADWVAGRSDINTVIVLQHASAEVLDALAPVDRALAAEGLRAAGRARPRRRSSDAALLFPMELDDIKRQHRVLAGDDPFAGIATDEAALRRECAQEAFGKLLRLRAVLPRARRRRGGAGAHDDRVGEEPSSSSSATCCDCAAEDVPLAYDAALAAGEAAVGPLPAMRQVLAQRRDASPRRRPPARLGRRVRRRGRARRRRGRGLLCVDSVRRLLAAGGARGASPLAQVPPPQGFVNDRGRRASTRPTRGQAGQADRGAASRRPARRSPC